MFSHQKKKIIKKGKKKSFWSFSTGAPGTLLMDYVRHHGTEFQMQKVYILTKRKQKIKILY